VEIPPLDDTEWRELVERGLSDEERESARALLPLAWEGATVHPRFVIRAVEHMLENSDSNLASAPSDPWVWHRDRARQLGRSEEIATLELAGLGRPVSAHDTEFLDRLGWSRPYAQRILASLEGQGIVRSIPDRRDRPGRPRKLYELAPAGKAR
jgi:hypothetical protein